MSNKKFLDKNGALELVKGLKNLLSIPTLEKAINIWNTPAGLYRVQSNSSIYYKGATSTATPLTIENETYMIITPENASHYKTFIVYSNVSATSRIIYSGHVREGAGTMSSMSVATSYATKEYVDGAIEEVINNLPSGDSNSKSNIIYTNSSTSPFVFSEQEVGLYILSNVSQFHYKVKTGDNVKNYRFDGNKNIVFILYKTKVDETITSLSDFARVYNLDPSSLSVRYLQLNLNNNVSSYTTNGSIIIDQANNQTISGQKRFVTLPITTVVPTDDTQFVNKKYVDDKIAEMLATINN